MRIVRAHLVAPAVTRWYHCVTRCARRAFLFGEGPNDRELGIENRLEQLAQIFGLSLTGFAVPDNHLPDTRLQSHGLPGLDPIFIRPGAASAA
jgi:hypothetical protein